MYSTPSPPIASAPAEPFIPPPVDSDEYIQFAIRYNLAIPANRQVLVPRSIPIEPKAAAAEKQRSTTSTNTALLAPASMTMHEDRTDPILEYQKRDAAKGFCEAQFALGLRYLTGNGVPKDEVTGWDWINQASKNGSLRAREKIKEHNHAVRKKWEAEFYKDVPK